MRSASGELLNKSGAFQMREESVALPVGKMRRADKRWGCDGMGGSFA